MAVAFARISVISRSAGRSATAAAAYRAGERIADERTGQTFDFTRRRGVEAAELLTPAEAPGWAQDRAALWNAAELAEKRKDARVAREVVLALPVELDPEQRCQLAQDFGGWLRDRHQVAVDISIHAPGREGDERNHHAHVLVSTRRLGRDGFGEKARELDDKKQGPEQITAWREAWGVAVNLALERAGFAERIDMRSYERQGLDREGGQHLGVAVAAMERRGERTDAGDANRAISERNAERDALKSEKVRVSAQIIDLETERERRATARETPNSDRDHTAETLPKTPPRPRIAPRPASPSERKPEPNPPPQKQQEQEQERRGRNGPGWWGRAAGIAGRAAANVAGAIGDLFGSLFSGPSRDMTQDGRSDRYERREPPPPPQLPDPPQDRTAGDPRRPNLPPLTQEQERELFEFLERQRRERERDHEGGRERGLGL